jgi:hypothetical protein
MRLSWEAISSLVLAAASLAAVFMHRWKIGKAQAQSAGAFGDASAVESKAVSFASRRSVLDGQGKIR